MRIVFEVLKYMFEHVSIENSHGETENRQKIHKGNQSRCVDRLNTTRNLVIVLNLTALQYSMKQQRLSIFLARSLCRAWSILILY